MLKCDKGWVYIWKRPCVKQWPPQTSFNLLAKAWKQEEGGDLSDGLWIGSWEKNSITLYYDNVTTKRKVGFLS